MTNTTRRALLIAGAALAASPVLAKLATAEILVLHSDGSQDALEALQALFRGEPVLHGGKVLRFAPGEPAVLPAGRYLLSDTWHIDRPWFVVENCTFVATPGNLGHVVSITIWGHVEGDPMSSFSRNHMDLRHA